MKNFSVIFRVLGLLLMFFSLTMFVPLGVSVFYQDGAHLTFISAFIVTFIIGFIFWIPAYKSNFDLHIRDGFLITSLFWTVFSVVGGLPFMLDPHLNLSLSAAVFETSSGLTTSGGTVIVGLDNLPKSILYYRAQLQFLGGIGVILIAVAILPMLGIGGMQLVRAETPGPVKDSKLTPRITQTAKWLFFIYSTINALCALSYWTMGMTLFDAICHSFATISLGGFSTHDASFAYFDNPDLLLVASFFMFISGFNFTLHFYFFSRGQLSQYFSDSESKFYFGYILISIIFTIFALNAFGIQSTLPHYEVHAIFQVISIASTAGFASTDYNLWPSFLPMLIFFLSIIGTCAGSTGGGMKVIRIIIIAKQGLREFKQLLHPNAVFPIKLKRKTVNNTILSAVWSFTAIYMLCFIFITFSLMATGMDYYTATAATLTTLNNMGGGLGGVAYGYGNTTATAQWIMSFSMILGRLEIFTLLVIFTPAFWRR